MLFKNNYSKFLFFSEIYVSKAVLFQSIMKLLRGVYTYHDIHVNKDQKQQSYFTKKK